MSARCRSSSPARPIRPTRPGRPSSSEWIRFSRRPEARPYVIFLSDYDMLLTEHLVQGVDVWINTPRRPWEASGTSGMKVLVNGGLNLSELDGWWAEAYGPDVGWAVGDGQDHGDDPAWDAAEAETLYERARTGRGAGVLHPRRDGHPDRLGRPDAREHGATDAALLRRTARCASTPSGTTFRLRRPTGRAPTADCALGSQMVDLAAGGGAALGRAPV